MNFVSRLCSLAVLSSLSFAPLAAQEVSGLVVCDPITVTFNYRFDLRGRAGEIGVLLVSPLLGPNGGLTVPGIGTLFLNPAVVLQLAAVPLNAQGQASVTLTPSMNDLGLVAQAAFLDPLRGTLRLSTNWIAMGHHKSVVDTIHWISSRYESQNNRFYTTIGVELEDKIEVILQRPGSPDVHLVPSETVDEPIETRMVDVVIRSGDRVVWKVNGVEEAAHTF